MKGHKYFFPVKFRSCRAAAKKNNGLNKIFGFAAAGASLAAFGSHAHAQTTIISDGFTSGSQYGTKIGQDTETSQGPFPGLSPSVIDLPGGPWQHVGGP